MTVLEWGGSTDILGLGRLVESEPEELMNQRWKGGDHLKAIL